MTWTAAALLAASPLPPQESVQRGMTAESPGVEDVVVTARPGPAPPLLDAPAWFRRLCFGPLRRDRRFASLEEDPEWTPLDAEARRAFRLSDPTAPAYGLTDPQRGHTLLVKFERLPSAKGWHVLEDRCTLAIIGGRNHRALPGAMAALVRASGTERHVGERDGAPRLDGWRQWLWTGMPGRRSADWRALKANGGRGPESVRLIVFDPRFYDRYDYIMGDLKTKNDPARPVSILSFARIRRVDRASAGR